MVIYLVLSMAAFALPTQAEPWQGLSSGSQSLHQRPLIHQMPILDFFFFKHSRHSARYRRLRHVKKQPLFLGCSVNQEKPGKAEKLHNESSAANAPGTE